VDTEDDGGMYANSSPVSEACTDVLAVDAMAEPTVVLYIAHGIHFAIDRPRSRPSVCTIASPPCVGI
jgi:hypothetical protein